MRWKFASDNLHADALSIEAGGYPVLRFWNHEVLGNLDSVLSEIPSVLTPTPPPPQGSRRGEGRRPACEASALALSQGARRATINPGTPRGPLADGAPSYCAFAPPSRPVQN
jgi:hypothetical protein